MSTTPFLVLSALLFSIGAMGVLVRRNAIVVFMCVELMLNASNLALVTFARVNGNLDGQVAVLLGERDQGEVGGVEHELDAHEHDDRVAAGEHPDAADREEDRGEDQERGRAHFSSSSPV